MPIDCSSYVATKQACASYQNCYAQAQGEVGSTISTANQLADSLKVQWAALKKIECLLDVILAAGDQAAMQACVDATHDTSALNIIAPANPPMQACDAGVPPTGCPA
ncbi:Uncharacterized protein SCF082_LOCUS45036 [Durusdinium trenchii]|uniref:Uncharacterized protein n=1 Tax=Durusdinium trenchii TaxID=1381693 RepID=A0ABP0R9V7_9DINO